MISEKGDFVATRCSIYLKSAKCFCFCDCNIKTRKQDRPRACDVSLFVSQKLPSVGQGEVDYPVLDRFVLRCVTCLQPIQSIVHAPLIPGTLRSKDRLHFTRTSPTCLISRAFCSSPSSFFFLPFLYISRVSHKLCSLVDVICERVVFTIYPELTLPTLPLLLQTPSKRACGRKRDAAVGRIFDLSRPLAPATLY